MRHKLRLLQVARLACRHVAAARTAAVCVGEHLAHCDEVAVQTRRPLHLHQQQLLHLRQGQAAVASSRRGGGRGRRLGRRPRPAAPSDLSYLLGFVLLAAP